MSRPPRAAVQAAAQAAAQAAKAARRIARWLGAARRGGRAAERLLAPDDPVLDALFDRAGIGMALVGRDGGLLRANAALAALVGPVRPGTPLAALFCPACREEVVGALAPLLAGSQAARSFTSLMPGPDGEQTVQVLPTPLRAEGRDPGALVLHILNLTAQTRLEARLAHGERLQAVGQLTGGIAHDFNNLLTAILGAADEALGRPALEPALRDDLRQIHASAERGAALVAKLLAFGRQQTLQPQVVRVNEAVREVAGLLRRLLGNRISLEVDLEEPGRSVRVDPTQLDQVLLNLAVNARDAMPGGGRLKLRTGHLSLLRPLLRGDETIPPGRYVTIEVADTGAGIPPETLPRIFDPFFTTKRDQGGSGLGLASVHGVVRQSSGFVSVESAVGEGTTFRVHLPRHDGPAEPRPAPAAAKAREAVQEAVRDRRALLLVDDEEPVRRLAERALGQRGWLVLAAESGEAALELVAQAGWAGRLALVVSDVVMPGLDGPALVRALRQAQPGLPAILASGYADEALRQAMARERVAFLAKPYTPKALAALIEATVRDAAG